jgi:hypothetical protein
VHRITAQPHGVLQRPQRARVVGVEVADADELDRLRVDAGLREQIGQRFFRVPWPTL